MHLYLPTICDSLHTTATKAAFGSCSIALKPEAVSAAVVLSGELQRQKDQLQVENACCRQTCRVACLSTLPDLLCVVPWLFRVEWLDFWARPMTD